jgi:hypothetical protein
VRRERECGIGALRDIVFIISSDAAFDFDTRERRTSKYLWLIEDKPASLPLELKRNLAKIAQRIADCGLPVRRDKQN